MEILGFNGVHSMLGIYGVVLEAIILLAMIAFYIFRWKPLAYHLRDHVMSETEANKLYAKRAKERDRLTEEAAVSINELKHIIDHMSRRINGEQKETK